jgi:hypothetical protein
MSAGLTRVLSWILLGAYLSACHSWYPAVLDPRTAIDQERPKEVRLWTRTGEPALQMKAPRVVGDTIEGAVHGQPTQVALNDVERVAVRRFNPWKTVLLILVVTPIALVGVVLVGCAASDCTVRVY